MAWSRTEFPKSSPSPSVPESKLGGRAAQNTLGLHAARGGAGRAGLGSLSDPQFKARLLLAGRARGRPRQHLGFPLPGARRPEAAPAAASAGIRCSSPAGAGAESRPHPRPRLRGRPGLRGRLASALPALGPAGGGLTEELGHDRRAPAQGGALLAGELQRHGQAYGRGSALLPARQTATAPPPTVPATRWQSNDAAPRGVPRRRDEPLSPPSASLPARLAGGGASRRRSG